LDGNYRVYFGNQQVGNVSVQRLGLYYRFSCRCQLTGNVICRLQIICGNVQENIGIPVPVNGEFGLDTKLPVKRFGEGKPEFTLVPKYEFNDTMFVPVYPEEPFAYIARLKDAYLVRKNGQMGIALK